MPRHFLISALMILNVFVSAVSAAVEVRAVPPPSTTAQKLYRLAKDDLLQLRILIRNGRTQAAVGSGFMVGTGNLVVTNYHVVSNLALKPKTYLGEYLDTSGRSGSIELLAVDLLNDLAVVRIDRKGNGFFSVPDTPPVLRKGQYLYSLGNPLDLGFTISEGSYNGIMRRSFYDRFLFTGPINSGMSGGPCITSDGQLAGVNVAKRVDEDLVSFIVPAKYVHELLKKVPESAKPAMDFKEAVGRQLLTYQAVMVDKVLEGLFTYKTLGIYRVPVRESDQMRCWGDTGDKTRQLYTVQVITCDMESPVYVSKDLVTGVILLRHQYQSSTRLGSLRFSQVVGGSLKNEKFGDHKSKELTAPACTEQFLSNGSLSMRAVMCVRAYKKFAGLYDFSVLSDTANDPLMNLESRLDLRGVSYENGLRFSRMFLESIGREQKP